DKATMEFEAVDEGKIGKILIDGKHASEDDLKVVDAKVKEVVVAAADFAQSSPEPDAAELYTDILIGG
ncbi:MAG TPA: pyruvate dehydrogenase (acetyl-transferring) E1 component subunit alpha, partial [Magnetospirillaceae bacterium]|nr:pyruvate dehydrogenase (acetyl-transferring) E1 component subunit alpha [Magnetospirillaceae bacterium]